MNLNSAAAAQGLIRHASRTCPGHVTLEIPMLIENRVILVIRIWLTFREYKYCRAKCTCNFLFVILRVLAR